MSSYLVCVRGDGDPDHRGAPAWPRYDVETCRELNLDDSISVGAGFRDRSCEFWDKHMPPAAPKMAGKGRGYLDVQALQHIRCSRPVMVALVSTVAMIRERHKGLGYLVVDLQFVAADASRGPPSTGRVATTADARRCTSTQPMPRPCSR